MFEGASGVACILGKCQLAPIRCSKSDLSLAVEYFPCAVVDFPLCCLSIPLLVTKLPKSAWQPLVDDIAHRLPTWKGRLMHRSGCMTLITTTLATIPAHTTFSLELPPWVCKALVKIKRGFLWERRHFWGPRRLGR
jgi:hypothetical protein